MSSDPTPSQLPPSAADAARPRAKPRKRRVRAQDDATQPMPHTSAQERRRHERADVRMLVQVVSADRVASYMAENLSAGGALLREGPELPAGTELNLALKLRGDTWHVRARVVRVDRDADGRPAIAVAFPSIVPKIQDLIQSHVLSCLRKSARSLS